ncbi:MAG: superoxide dismutase [Solirubrobacteraceae bacterium]
MRPAREGDLRAEVMAAANDELAALWELYADGVVREMYSPGGLGALLILEVESLQEARDRLSRLPLIKRRLMDLEVLELAPFRALEMLFREALDDESGHS